MGKILFVPMLTYGHFNCCINLGRLLISKHPEHEVHFLVSDKWASKLETWEPKFKSLIFMKDSEVWKKAMEERKNVKNEENDSEIKQVNEKTKEEEALLDVMKEFGDEWKKPAIERIKDLGKLCKSFLDTQYEYQEKIEQLVNELDPDVILFDHIIMIPFLLNRKWIQIMTISSLFMDHPEIPPYSSGLTSNKKIASEEWNKFRIVNFEHSSNYLQYLNRKLIEAGQQPVRPLNLITESPYFNIYIYPKEIDYYSVSSNVKLPGRWLRLDSSFLPTKTVDLLDSNDREGRFKRIRELYKVPDNFFKSDSKIIFFSLGSMASGYRDVLDRLLDLISKVPEHRFIVSKGPLGDQVILPDNCIGEAFVNQFETLKVCDLMISHGGNNTLTECFHMGIKLIILPLFSDQPDNAQRLVDTKMGYSLNPFTCTQVEFDDTIDRALNNVELTNKMKAISERIRTDNGMNGAVQELHNLIIA